MPTLIDSYSETNHSGAAVLVSNLIGHGTAQSFTGTVATLDSAKFYLAKVNSPTGSAYAKLYAHTGTFGVDSKPTGTALATSDAFDVSTLTTSFILVTFNFTGANRYDLTATNYCIAFEFLGGDGANYVGVGQDHTSPSHAGNRANKNTSDVWGTNNNTRDDIFYVYGSSTPSSSLSPSSSTSPSLSPSSSTSPSSSISSSISPSASVSPSASTSISPSSSISPSASSTASASTSPSSSASASVSPSASSSPSLSPSSSASPSSSRSPSTSVSPSPSAAFTPTVTNITATQQSDSIQITKPDNISIVVID